MVKYEPVDSAGKVLAENTSPLALTEMDVAELLVTAVFRSATAPPAPAAGLPDCGSIVAVEPPLLARAPSSGLIGLEAVPTELPLVPLLRPVMPVPLPIRLFVP